MIPIDICFRPYDDARRAAYTSTMRAALQRRYSCQYTL